MKDINTYIDKNKFQFITSFENVEISNTKGEKIILDFNNLDIDERIFLSAFLTYMVQTEGVKTKDVKNNLYDIVFNFNNDFKKQPSYYKNFMDVISSFLKSKVHYLAYIIDYYNEIKDNKTIIYRTQLNRSEMDLLYSMQFRCSYSSMFNVLYIMGVAKSNVCTKKLNKIPLSRFYKDSVSMSKKRATEIMEKLNLKYQIYEDNVYFGNGFEIELDEKYYSDEKKQYQKDITEEDILSSFNKEYNEEEIETYKEIIETVKAEPVIEENNDYAGEDFSAPVENIDSILDIGDGHFKWEIFEKLNDFNHNEPYSIETEYAKMKEKFPEITGKALSALLVKYSLDINALVRKNENIFKIYKGEQLGENWKEIKDNARVEFLNIQNIVCKNLSKLYDNNYEIYKYIVLYLITAQKKTLTFKF